MKRSLVSVLPLLLLVLSCGELPAHVGGDFVKANQLYEEGNYAEAGDLYRGIITKGVESGVVHYNLANTHMRLGDVGHALVEYERARRLLPRNEDIARNQKYATDLVKTPEFAAKSHSATARLAEGAYETFNLREWALLAIGAFLLFLATSEGLLLAPFLRDKAVWAYGAVLATTLIALIPLCLLAALLTDSMGLWTTCIAGILGALLLGIQAVRERWREGGFTVARSALLVLGFIALSAGVAFGMKYREYRVLNLALALDPKTEVRDAPGPDAKVTRYIPQGTRLLLTRWKDDFVEVTLPDMSKGWVDRKQAGEVRVQPEPARDSRDPHGADT